MRRLRQMRVRRRTVVSLFAALALLVAVAVAYAVVGPTVFAPRSLSAANLSAQAPLPSKSLMSVDGSGAVVASASADGTNAVDLEVPPVVGKSVKVAEAVISGAGFAAQTRVADPPAPGVAPDTVLEQWPAAGALVQPGSPVIITYQPRTGGSALNAPIVVIDPGHQKTANLTLEPIGPGSKITKAKVAGGATGVSTGAAEYRRDLEIALRLKAVLVSRGVKVVMTRTTDDVDVSNSQRAKIGNKAKADLVVRIHCDTSADTSRRGVSTLFPSGNSWTKAIEAPSTRAADAIESALAKTTSSPALGTFGRSDMSGFNYSERPVVMVLCGFLSNASEDTQLGDSAYQAKVASGIAEGVLAFLDAR